MNCHLQIGLKGVRLDIGWGRTKNKERMVTCVGDNQKTPKEMPVGSLNKGNEKNDPGVERKRHKTELSNLQR